MNETTRQAMWGKLAWMASMPTLVGIVAWALYWPVEWRMTWLSNFAGGWGQISKGLATLFMVMFALGPFSTIAALVLTKKSGVRGWKRGVSFVLNGGWLLFSLAVWSLYFAWRGALQSSL